MSPRFLPSQRTLTTEGTLNASATSKQLTRNTEAVQELQKTSIVQGRLFNIEVTIGQDFVLKHGFGRPAKFILVDTTAPAAVYRVADNPLPDSQLVLRAENPGLWSHIETQTVSSASTSVTFSNLNGNTDRGYYWEVYWLAESSAPETQLTLRPNGLTGDFGSMAIEADLTLGTINNSVAGLNGFLLSEAGEDGDTPVSCQGWISSSATGTVRHMYNQTTEGMFVSSNPQLQGGPVVGLWDDTTTNITSLVFQTTDANKILAGSKFSIYRKTAATTTTVSLWVF